MANGTRFLCYNDQSTDLVFITLKNGSPLDVYDFQKVEIFNTYAKAQTALPADVIQTITSANITRTALGTYKYVSTPKTLGGVYFDKPYIVFENGMGVNTFINPFYITTDAGGAQPSPHERCRVYLNLFDIISNPQLNERVTLRMTPRSAWYAKDLIESEEEVFKADINGQVIMDLIETDTLTLDTGTPVYYQVNVNGKFYTNIQVPKGTLNASFKDLPVYVVPS